jgi:23S rRNA A2030 N6-methylase RlmJ
MSYDRSKLTHNLSSGDRVRVKGFKTMSHVKEVLPKEHWENCVVLDPPLRGWKHWDAHDLEKV